MEFCGVGVRRWGCASAEPFSWRSAEFPPSRAWLSAHSTDSCLSSDPTAFVPVFRTPGRAHRAQVHIRAPPVHFQPLPRGNDPSQRDGASPALPRAVLCRDIKPEWFLQTQRLFREEESPPAPFLLSLVLSKNSPEHLKMCSNLLTGKWMRSQGWQGLVERMLILTHPIDPSGEKKSGGKGPRMSFFSSAFCPYLWCR